MPDYTIKQGNTLPILEEQITLPTGRNPDLTDAVAQLLVEPFSGTQQGFVVQADIADPVKAILRYQFNSGQTQSLDVGLYRANFHIDFPNGDSIDWPTHGSFSIEVEPRLLTGAVQVPYRPSTRDVAQAYLMARTRDAYNNYVGDFTDKTAITNEQAAVAIENAIEEVESRMGGVMPDMVDDARRLVMLLAAANLEGSFFPDDAAQPNSWYDKLMVRYNALIETVSEEEAAEEQAFNEQVTGAFPRPMGWETRRW